MESGSSTLQKEDLDKVRIEDLLKEIEFLETSNLNREEGVNSKQNLECEVSMNALLEEVLSNREIEDLIRSEMPNSSIESLQLKTLENAYSMQQRDKASPMLRDVKAAFNGIENSDNLNIFDEFKENGRNAPQDVSHQAHQNLPKRTIKKISFWLTLFSIFIAISGLCYIGFQRIKMEITESSIKACLGISDMALAFAHAQLVGADTDLEMSSVIEEHLKPVILSKIGNYTLRFDYNGCVASTDYEIKVCFDKNLEQFLVIASPKQDFWKNLFHHPVLIISSEDFEVRSLNSLKDLESALGIAFEKGKKLYCLHEKFLSSLFKITSEIVPTAEFLVETETSEGFFTPYRMSQEASPLNFPVYNLPRYYHFGLMIFQKRMDETWLHPENVEGEKYHLNNLMKMENFKNLVIYSDQGKEYAQEMESRLLNSPFRGKMQIGYLSFNQDGMIENAYLLNEPFILRENGMYENSKSQYENNTFQNLSSKEKDVYRFSAKDKALQLIDQYYPCFVRLTGIAQKRQKALENYSESLVNLLKLQNQSEREEFRSFYDSIFEQYWKESQFQSKVIEGCLKEFYEECKANKEESIFYYYINALGMLHYLPSDLKNQINQGRSVGAVEKIKIEALPYQIQKAKDFSDLNAILNEQREIFAAVEQGNGLEKVKNDVLMKIEAFLLSPEYFFSSLEEQLFQRSNLEGVLNAMFVFQQDKRNYYLNQFDILMEKRRLQSKQAEAFVSPNAIRKKNRLLLGMQVNRDNLNGVSPLSEKEDSLEAPQYRQKEEWALKCGLVGEQIISREKGLKIDTVQIVRLKEALDLLYEGVVYNTNLWSSIFQARQMIVLKLEHQIEQILTVQQEIFLNGKNTVISLKAELGNILQYYRGYILRSSQITSKAEEMEKKLEEMFEKAITSADGVEKSIFKFDHLYKEYEGQIEAHLEDSQIANDAGYFMKDLKLYTALSQLLGKKIKALKEFKTSMNENLNQLLYFAQGVKKLSVKGLSDLHNPPSLTQEKFYTIEKNIKSIAIPIFTQDGVLSKFHRLLDMEFPLS